jgi:putative phage-type endonuclease
MEELEDITDNLIFEDPPSIFDEETTIELIETAFHLMDQYMENNPSAITEPDFHEDLFDEIFDLFSTQLEDHIHSEEQIEHDMHELLEEAFEIYISTFHTERSLKENKSEQHYSENNHFITNNNTTHDESVSIKILEIQEKINYLKSMPQPVQRTKEWYEFRHNLITASNAYKAFESQSKINELIYEKCQPLKQFNDDSSNEEVKIVNTNTTLHWGQKYEPLSVMIYEHIYKTKVDDFGCLKHPHYKFIGASPDGINIDTTSDRFGRMLEIKNVVNREINGIPKKEYWIQMQLQMEVCDLDDCDFLETKFVEYPDYNTYINDDNLSANMDSSITSTFFKGIIIHFHTKDGAPFYVYKPIDLVSQKDIEHWEESSIEKYQSEPYNYIFMKFIYWKLDKISCVLVQRNREWFKNNIQTLEKIWETIENERIHGSSHRAPNKKQKKDSSKPFVGSSEETQCSLFSFMKTKQLENINIHEDNQNT